ncbi:hypothetical protein WFJ45_23290, partial [Salmonella enterica subsp. enterica serovar Minnesota]|uniref:hypothetical protein n=1 Tax=Salmonella enterica TaxID=28901 RepID=UPI003D286DF9
ASSAAAISAPVTVVPSARARAELHRQERVPHLERHHALSSREGGRLPSIAVTRTTLVALALALMLA